MKRTRLWRRAAVIIIALFLLAGTACGKKGDPLPPEKPKAETMFNGEGKGLRAKG
ncbi:MAG TPA: hypothetical protein PKV89_07415 [Syntrophales bacterium]|nr:hypothetical protein [Syntrophales bacterium]